MRTMRIPAMMLATAAQLAWATTSVAAQAAQAGTSTADQIAQYTTTKLTTELNLTPDQVPKVQKVNVASAKELEKLVAKYEKDTSIAGDAALVKGYAQLVRANQVELKKILTPAQWTMHQQNKAERLARTQTEFMAYDLDLSVNQLTDVERINLSGANQLVTALDNVPGAKPTQQARLAAAKPIIDARDAALEKVLTVDQFKKMQANRRALHDLLLAEATAAPTSAAAAAPKPKP